MDEKTSLFIALFILSIFLIISLVTGCRTYVNESFNVGSFPPAPKLMSPASVSITSSPSTYTSSPSPSPSTYISSPSTSPSTSPSPASETDENSLPLSQQVIEEEEIEEEEIEEEEIEEEDTNQMTASETELFKQITTNKISSTDLEKLIKAGIVNEKMIEKFLERIDSGDNIEPFCSGQNCGSPLK